MFLQEYLKQMVKAAAYGTMVPRTNLDREMDIFVRIQTLLGALNKSEGQVESFFRDHRSASDRKMALVKLSKNNNFKKTRQPFFSTTDTGMYSRVRKTIIRLVGSAGFGDLDADDILQSLILGMGLTGGERKMAFVDAGYSNSSGIKSGSTTLMNIGNTVIGYANNMIRTEIKTRTKQRGRYDPIPLQPGMESGIDHVVRHEIATFKNLGLRDRFELLVDIVLGRTVLGRDIIIAIHDIIERLPKRRAEIGHAWFDALLDRSAPKGSIYVRGLNKELLEQFGVAKGTMSDHIKRVMDAINNELPKNTRIMDRIDMAIQEQEMGHGLRQANKKRAVLASRIVRRYKERHQIS